MVFHDGMLCDIEHPSMSFRVNIFDRRGCSQLGSPLKFKIAALVLEKIRPPEEFLSKFVNLFFVTQT